MSDSTLTKDKVITPDKESGTRVKTDHTSFTPSFDKLQVQTDSESSGDEVTAFDRIRESSDSDEADEEKTIEVIPAARDKSPEPKESTDSLPENKLEPDNSEKVIKPESVNSDVDTPNQESHVRLYNIVTLLCKFT